ncbi:hypothetical protein AB4Z34_33475 [Ensifer sp. 2YAB10]|uniref:hypothetical protein n=1 Tax=unclassified Ensifer TaxID=2633371 RepID=UPI003F8F8806
MTYRQRFLAGIAVGIFILAVCIETVRAIYDHGWVCTFDSVLQWIGRFRWLYDYQTIVAGLAAAGVVVWQIRQADRFQHDKFEAQRASARAVLPLVLSEISDYAEATSSQLQNMRDRMVRGVFPGNLDVPAFPVLPGESVDGLRAMVEASHQDERIFLSRLLTVLQVLRSRTRGLVADRRHVRAIHEDHVLAIMINCAEVYARAAAMYDFGRGESETLPKHILATQVRSGLFLTGIHGELRDRLVERYRLDRDEPFEW